MQITGTLTQLKQYFEKWHTDKFATLHRLLYQELERIEDKSDNDNDYLTGKVLVLANLISKKLDGNTTQITNLDNLNQITSKQEATDNSINFKSLNSRLNTLSPIIEAIQSKIGIDASGSNKTILERISDLESSTLSNVNVNNLIQSFFNGKTIATNDNLDTYKTAGVYKCDNTTALTIQCPVQKGFHLTVLPHANNSVRQFFMLAENNRIWTRNYYNNTESWSNWTELYGEHNTSLIQMEVEFSDSTRTYTFIQKTN